jgi:hypothetical protein
VGIQARHLWNMKKTPGWEVFEQYLKKELEYAERQVMKPEIPKGTREFFAGEMFFGKKKVFQWLERGIEIGKQGSKGELKDG